MRWALSRYVRGGWRERARFDTAAQAWAAVFGLAMLGMRLKVEQVK